MFSTSVISQWRINVGRTSEKLAGGRALVPQLHSHQLPAGADPKLGGDVFQVGFYRADREAEPSRDLPVGLPFGGEVCHTKLLGGQLLRLVAATSATGRP